MYGSAEKTSSAAPATLPSRTASRERALVDELAAGGVDDPDAVAHLRDRVGVDEACACLVGQRQVQGQELGRGEDLRRVSACSAPSSRKRSGATNGS